MEQQFNGNQMAELILNHETVIPFLKGAQNNFSIP